jgi:SH3 domain-containing YSC84-like protein 1
MRPAQGHTGTRVTHTAVRVLATFLLLASGFAELKPASDDDMQDAGQLVEKAHLTFESFQANPQMGPSLRALVQRAKEVMVYPQVLRGSFLFGAPGGNGVFLTRHQQSNTCAGPAFHIGTK